MLVLSSRKPLRWVFVGAPTLLKLAGVQPATNCFHASGCKTALTFFSHPLPLPMISHVALSEARSAEREAMSCDDHPESPTQASKCGEAPSLFPKSQAHPAEDFQHTQAPSCSSPFFSFGPPSGPFSLLRKKRKWGAGPAAEPHAPAPSADGAILTSISASAHTKGSSPR